MQNIYKRRFTRQKWHAINRRGIEWQLTFEEWSDWWGTDIDNRGCKNGQLVMARFNDIGPYSLSNIKKITANANHVEANAITKNYKSVKAVSAEGQRFNSMTQAGKHFNVLPSTIRDRIKTRPNEYFYIV